MFAYVSRYISATNKRLIPACVFEIMPSSFVKLARGGND